jgi:hypothetical protein
VNAAPLRAEALLGSATGRAHPGGRWPLERRPPPAEVARRTGAGPQQPDGRPRAAGPGLPRSEGRSGPTADPPRTLALLRTRPLPWAVSPPLTQTLLRSTADPPMTELIARRERCSPRAGRRSAAQAPVRPPGPEPPASLPWTTAPPRVARAPRPAPTRRRPAPRPPRHWRTAPLVPWRPAPVSWRPAQVPWPPDPGRRRPAPDWHPAPESGRRPASRWAALALEATGLADPAQTRPPGSAGALSVGAARSRTPRSAGSPLLNGTGRPARPDRRRPQDPAPEPPGNRPPRPPWRPTRGIRVALPGDVRAGGWGRSFGPRKLPRAAPRTGVGPSLSRPAGFRDSPCPQPTSVPYRRRAPGVRLEPS